ncbi:carbohydrate-binding protein [Archangium sp.]|uniref:carbohydrate-binding protein n=1 Tax=Archangium sp. TaxID=1872627 RepID=UPI00389A9B68
MNRLRLLSALCASALLASAAGCDSPGPALDSQTPSGINGGTSGGDLPGTPEAQPPASSPPPSTSAPEPTPEPVPEPTPEPAPQPTPQPTPSPTPAPASDKDAFGVKMLYPTKAGGETWSLKEDALKDARFDPQDTITRNADGSWKMKSTQVRMEAFTTTGYDSKKIPSYDRDVLASRGYMQSPNDWKNVEMTGFVKVNAASDMADNFAWYARGGRHTDSLACEGSSYKGNLSYSGKARWEKESWHVSYDNASWKTVTASLKGRWVGFKSVMRNTSVNGKPAVRLELWLNDNADKVTWKKVDEKVDDGTWGGDANHCGGSVPAMPISWGGPIATFRWDSASDVDFKWLSVREITE